MLTHEQIEKLQRLRQAARLHPPRYAIVPTCDGITLEIRDYYSAVIHCAGVLVDAAARLAEVYSRLDPVMAAECAIPDDSELIVDVLIRKLSELDTARSKLEAEPHARATRLERALAELRTCSVNQYNEYCKQIEASRRDRSDALRRLRFAEAELERRDRSVTGTTFEEVWKGKEAQGYRYGSDALESVRFGWELAVSQKFHMPWATSVPRMCKSAPSQRE